MTWGLFLLYNEGPQEFADVVALTTSQMESSRKFHRFGRFAQELLRPYRERPEGARVPLLYPAILEWAARQ